MISAVTWRQTFMASSLSTKLHGRCSKSHRESPSSHPLGQVLAVLCAFTLLIPLYTFTL